MSYLIMFLIMALYLTAGVCVMGLDMINQSVLLCNGCLFLLIVVYSTLIIKKNPLD